MEQHTFLLEIGTEELPPRMLRRLGVLFVKNIKNGFRKFNISYKDIICFVSSRRLAVKVIGMFIDIKLITNCGSVNLYVHTVNECPIPSDRCFFNDEGITLLLNSVMYDVLTKFTISVTTVMMRWNDNRNVKFIRPVRTLTMLLDDKLIFFHFFGICTNRIVRGHRFMGEQEVVIDHAKNYEILLLNNGFVVANYERRKEIIRNGIQNIAKKIGGFVYYADDFLEEITGLSEWPVVLFGSFNKEFLSLPYEILLYIMTVKKKYFPVHNSDKELLPYFIFVIDIITDDFKKIIAMHERVLYPHFLDAQFFLHYDKKYRLEDYLFQLRTVLFHKKLGTLYDKTMRIKVLSSWMAKKVDVNVSQVERAAILSKCDLLSRMVFEFPCSQGMMGMYYARRDGELEEVALVQKEHYFPRYFSDVLPSTLMSCIVSIADKIDTISGVFLIEEDPKGSGDPLGIRRLSIAVLRIFTEKRIKINFCDVLETSLRLYEDFLIEGYVEKVLKFMYKRLCVLYENKGYNIDVIQATLSENLINLVNFDERVHAVSLFFELNESKLLANVYKRIFNILKNISDLFKYEFRNSLLIEKEEIILSKKLIRLYKEFTLMCNMGYYYDALVLLLTICTPVENFFSSVMVISEDKQLRLNRLVLLYKIWLLPTKIINTPHLMFNINLHKKRKIRSIIH